MTKKRRSAAWRVYQEKAAESFRGMGFDANVEENLEGARGKHEIDVVVRTKLGGVPTLWVVECKHWKTSVPKAQVLTLVQIAQDVGADRAFLLSEKGFQAGAIAVVRRTNVSLTSIDELEATSADSIAEASIRRSLTQLRVLEDALRDILYEQGPRTPPPPLLDETIELLGACFEVTMAATATLMLRFPVRLPEMLLPAVPTRTDEPAVVAKALASTLSEIEKRSAVLTAALKAATSRAADDAEELTRRVRKLLAYSDTLLNEISRSDAEDARLRDVLRAMVAVGDQLETLRDVPTAELARAISAVRRELFDGVYLWVANPVRTPDMWAQIKAAAEKALSGLTSAVCIAAPRRDADSQ